MLVIAFFDQFFQHLAGIQKRFYELLSHWRSPLDYTLILGVSESIHNRPKTIDI
jgi:hypothetical protein